MEWYNNLNPNTRRNVENLTFILVIIVAVCLLTVGLSIGLTGKRDRATACMDGGYSRVTFIAGDHYCERLVSGTEEFCLVEDALESRCP